MDVEADGLEKVAVSGGGGEEADGEGFGVEAVGGEDGGERGADGGDVALAAHLGDEAGSGFEGSVNVGEGGCWSGAGIQWRAAFEKTASNCAR